jgi:streptomycin 6-kinase
MSQPPDIPIPPDLTRRYSRSAGGRAWLASLPRLISGCLTQWRLEPELAPGTLPWNGHGAIVVPVRRAAEAPAAGKTTEGESLEGAAAVLKISYPHDEAVLERHALNLWAGNGAVRVLAADAGSVALLLERLDARHSLQETSMEAAIPVWGGLVRRLSLLPDLTPDGRPEWWEFDHVAARAEQWSDELPAAWEQLARPFPRWLLEAALEVCQTRGAVGRRAGKDVLVHTDLHYRNVLARPGSAEPSKQDPAGVGGFAAIDPQPMIGEAEFAVAPLLWNRLRELDRSDPRGALLRRCRDFSAAAGLDAETARQWSLAREVENALWYAARREHDGDLARSLWVASTLAGRTLPELPAPHELPAPGDSVHR